MWNLLQKLLDTHPIVTWGVIGVVATAAAYEFFIKFVWKEWQPGVPFWQAVAAQFAPGTRKRTILSIVFILIAGTVFIFIGGVGHMLIWPLNRQDSAPQLVAQLNVKAPDVVRVPTNQSAAKPAALAATPAPAPTETDTPEQLRTKKNLGDFYESGSFGQASSALLNFSVLTQANFGRTAEKGGYNQWELISWLIFYYPYHQFEGTDQAVRTAAANSALGINELQRIFQNDFCAYESLAKWTQHAMQTRGLDRSFQPYVMWDAWDKRFQSDVAGVLTSPGLNRSLLNADCFSNILRLRDR